MNELQLLDTNSLCEKLKEQKFNFSPSTIYNTIRYLGVQPCRIEILPNKRRRFYYDKKALSAIIQELNRKLKNKEYRKLNFSKCYACGKYDRVTISGLCLGCHAYKFAKNYTNRGTIFDYIYDSDKAHALLKALQNIINSFQ